MLNTQEIDIKIKEAHNAQAQSAKMIYDELEAETVRIKQRIKELLMRDLELAKVAKKEEAVQRYNDIIDLLSTAKHNYYSAVSNGYAGCHADAAEYYYMLLENYTSLVHDINLLIDLLNEI